ncbi:MAG: toll/interleukin-1 receptor domain-containing protein [Bacteroidales bacterium]|nr:toll/interleukin-1 receptor domain-containing protein [Bacteroidales bacterium]MDY6347311.1 toll/interleukin-1 receptor domain-containing protein [Bacteroidales bacterium]
MKGGNDMGKSIYQIALDCSKYASKNVAYFQNNQNGRTWFSVMGADKQYEHLLLTLCDLTKVKYPLLSDSLRKHVLQYDLHPVKHQSAIDELVNYILHSEEDSLDCPKFFISHSSDDALIIKGFVEKILQLGCGFKRTDIFCTLDHTAIRTGDEFRDVIIDKMKRCDYILCFVSDNYRKSEVCQNELGAAWAFDYKRVLPFKFPNIEFKEIGFLNVVKQAADITDKSKLDELYGELCEHYDIQPDWRNFNEQKDAFVELVNTVISKGSEVQNT